MKRNDIRALHQLSVAELRKKLQEVEQQLSKARLEKKAGRLSNPRQVSRLSDDMARVLTIIDQKVEA